MIEEVWKDVVGYGEYFKVSNLGNVYSKRTHKVLKQTPLKTGYLVINSRIGGREGLAISLRVHRMVAEAFLDSPDISLVEVCSKQHHGKVLVRHKDHNKLNNTLSNLEWGSCQDNSDDSKRDGKLNTLRGHSHPCSKLSYEEVKFIRENYVPRDKLYGCRSLAKMFGVTHMVISSIVLFKTYKD